LHLLLKEHGRWFSSGMLRSSDEKGESCLWPSGGFAVVAASSRRALLPQLRWRSTRPLESCGGLVVRTGARGDAAAGGQARSRKGETLF
jgi:hypothetical protein